MRRLLRRLRENKVRYAGIAAVFLLSALRFAANGFVYYPQLDDYIQYYKYTSLCTPSEAVVKYGMLAARPLSNAADVFIWAKFWGCLFLAVLIISALYAASALIFRYVFSHIFGTGGTAFVLLYLLLPLNIEGTYWLSASTRVVCGLFWVSLAALLFIKWLDARRPVYALLYGVFQLFAMAAYEQTLVLTAALTVFIMLAEFDRNRSAVFAGLLTLSNGLIYYAFISAFRGGSALYGSAYDAVSPFTSYFWTNQLPHVLKQLAAAFAGGGFFTLAKGFIRGVGLYLSGDKIIYLFAAIIASALVFLLYTKRPDTALPLPADKRSRYSACVTVILGLLLALAPTAPHFIKSNPWFSLRGTVCSLPGLALAFQSLADSAGARIRRSRKAKASAAILKPIPAIACAVFVFAALTASASELDDYKKTYENDTALMTALSDTVELTSLTGRIALVGVEANYLEGQNFYYHEHIHGVTESDWALSGALYAFTGGALDPAARIVPIPGDSAVEAFAGDGDGGYDAVYIYDGKGFILADQPR